MDACLGQRIIVIGSAGSGKSTLAEQLAARIGCPCVELDALNWEPGWVAAPDDVFHERIHAATAGPAWVMAGNYTSRQQHLSWPLADTIIWLDLSLARVLPRVWRRTWRRALRREELWGGNRESLRNMLSLWDPDRSLLAYTVRTHRKRRRAFEAMLNDPRWAHVAFIRLRSPGEVAGWLDTVPAKA